jgi:hypothetical protein
MRIASMTLASLVICSACALVAATPTSVQSPIPSPAASASELQPVLLPRGTVVIVKILHGVNSYGQEAGAKLTYEVVQDVVVSGYVFAKAGDVAEGVIQNAQEGRDDLFSTRAANLRVTVDSIFNFCGDKIETDFVRSEFRQRQGLFGSHKDVEIIKGQMYQVPTERAQKVCAEPTTEISVSAPPNALPGDKN